MKKKKEITKLLYKELLDNKNNITLQTKILKDWKNLGYTPNELEYMLPALFSKQDAISTQEEKFYRVHIDSNKIAFDFKTKISTIVHIQEKFIEKYKINFSDQIYFIMKNDTQNQTMVYFKNEKNSQLFSYMLENLISIVGIQRYFKRTRFAP